MGMVIRFCIHVLHLGCRAHVCVCVRVHLCVCVRARVCVGAWLWPAWGVKEIAWPISYHETTTFPPTLLLPSPPSVAAVAAAAICPSPVASISPLPSSPHRPSSSPRRRDTTSVSKYNEQCYITKATDPAKSGNHSCAFHFVAPCMLRSWSPAATRQ